MNEITDQLSNFRATKNVDGILAAWKSAEDWKPLQETMFDMANEAADENRLADAARLLMAMARDIDVSTPYRGSERGLPSWPHSHFVSGAVGLYMGDEDAKTSLESHERWVRENKDLVSAQRSGELAYLGWAYCLAGQEKTGREKLLEAADIAKKMPQPNYAVPTLIEVAHIMADAGLTKEALSVLGRDSRSLLKPERFDEFVSGSEVIRRGSVQHLEIAKTWTARLEAQLAKARALIVARREKSGRRPSLFGLFHRRSETCQSHLLRLLDDLGEQEARDQVAAHEFKAVIGTLRSKFDYAAAVVASATAAAMYEQSH